jgi:hypothetical protein
MVIVLDRLLDVCFGCGFVGHVRFSNKAILLVKAKVAVRSVAEQRLGVGNPLASSSTD